MQVCIAGYKKVGKLKILSHAFDRSLGGRDFDEALFQHFAAMFTEEYDVNLREDPIACLRLRASCEKLKTDLDVNMRRTPLNIEGLMDGKDVEGMITLDEFKAISSPILERVKIPLLEALAQARLTVENVHQVEVAGLGSLFPMFLEIIAEFFGKKPRRSMNSNECVAKGAALHCAILSPTFKIRDFQVSESLPFSIALKRKRAALDAQNGEAENPQDAVLVPHKKSVPTVRLSPFYRSGTFSFDVHHADTSENKAPRIDTFMIGPIQSSNSEIANLEVRVRMNFHGVVSAVSANLVEEEEEVKLAVVKEPTKMETDVANEPPKTIMTPDVPIAVYDDDAVYTFTAHTGELYTVACSPTDPHYVATGGGDERIFLWKIGGYHAVELQGHKDPVSCLAFSNDGMLLASGDSDAFVRMWDIPSGKLKCTVIGPTGPVKWLRWHPREHHQVMAGSEGSVLWLWNADTGAPLKIFVGHAGSVSCGDFTPDGNLICTGSEDVTLRVWNPRSGDTLHVVKGPPYHTEGLTCMAMKDSSTGSTLAISGSWDGSVFIVNINTEEVVTALIANTDPVNSETAHSDSVRCVAFAPSSSWAATGGMDGKLVIWDLDKHTCGSICNHPGGVTCLAWLGGSRYIATGCLDGKVRVWDSLSGQCTKTFGGHWNEINDMAVSADLDFIVSSSLDGTARVFDIHEFTSA